MGGALASPASFASGLVALVALAVSTKLPVPVLFGFWLGLCLGLWLGYTRWGAPPAADPRYAKKKFGKIGKFRGGANPKDPRYANGVIISVEDAEVIAWAREAGGSAREVDLSGCGKITDASVTEIARKCPALTMIRLYGCGKITDASVAEIEHGCPSLAYIRLSGCGNITDGAIAELKRRLLKCDVVR